MIVGGRVEPPQLRADSLRRPRLLELLHRRFEVPMTLVVAPPGYGKSTLLAQAHAEHRLAPRAAECWLRCSADDVAWSSLAEAIAASLATVLPAPQAPALSRAVDEARAQPGVEGLRAAARAIVDAVLLQAPDHVVVVLDDVHEIAPGTTGADLLAQLVDDLPANGHVVLSGRVRPPIPYADRVVAGRAHLLDAAALAFTEEETKAFANERGVPFERLAGYEGWPAMVEIAAVAGTGGDADFLWEVVLARLEPERRRRLALLTAVGAFDEDLAREVLAEDIDGHGDPGDPGDLDVAALVAPLPLVTSTVGGTWQVHGLWDRPMARVVPAEAVAAARRRAGLALGARGEAARGIRLLMQAGAWDDVSRAVVVALGADHPPVPGDLVATWLGRLPDHVGQTPVARLLDALSTSASDPAGAIDRLEGAQAAFEAAGDYDGELACIAQLTQLAWWSEQTERFGAIAGRLFALHAADHSRATPLVRLAEALLADLTNDCERELAALAAIPPGSLNDAWRSLMEWMRSLALNHLGRHDEALVAAEEATALAGPVYAPVISTSRLQALWYLGRIDQVIGQYPAVVEPTLATGLLQYSAIVASTSAMLLAADGRIADARRDLGRAVGAGAGLREVPLVDVNLSIAEAVVDVVGGDEDGAADRLEGYLQRHPDVPAYRGLAQYPQQRSLAFWYVLVPSSRPVWDDAELGGAFFVGRALARDLAAARDNGSAGDPAGGPSVSSMARRRRPRTPLPEPGVTRSILPLPWAVELALAHLAVDETDERAWALLEELWPRAQPAVRRHVQDGGPLAATARAVLGRLPVPPGSRLELRLLGPDELRRDGELVVDPTWRRARVRSILAFLALGDDPVGRETLAETLWPERPPGVADRNLRTNLTHLRQVLEPGRPTGDASFHLVTHGDALLLRRSEWFDCDLWRFDRLAGRAEDAGHRGRPSEMLHLTDQAIAEWRAGPTAWAAEDWAAAEIERRRSRLVALATRAAQIHLDAGHHADARRTSEAALRHEPTQGQAVRVAATLAALAEDPGGQRRILDRYAAALRAIGLPEAAVDASVQAAARTGP